MKLNLLINAVIIMFILSSCNYFKKHRLFSKDADTVLEMVIEHPEPVVEDTSTFYEEEIYTEPVVETEEVVASISSNRFFMIVGSFQNQNLANRYSIKISQMGYQSEVIEATNGFFRVSAKSYSDYYAGINDIENFRSTLSTRAWLHVKN